MTQGGCHCSAIRYLIDGTPMYETNCHCSICRKTSGALYIAWFTVKKSSFQLLSGTLHRYQSSSKGKRGFCGNCGTQLLYEDSEVSDEIDITTFSLDNIELIPPKDHTWVESKPSWVVVYDDIPKHQKSPYD